MFRSVSIEGYRGFARYQMHDLGRVNLLVGRNNSGKTTVLEALHVLGSDGDPTVIWQACDRRGEIFRDERALERRGDAALSHLFPGRPDDMRASFSVVGIGPDPETHRRVNIRILKVDPKTAEADRPLTANQVNDAESPFRLGIESRLRIAPVRLDRRGGLSLGLARMAKQFAAYADAQASHPVQFVSTAGIPAGDLVGLWDEVQLAGDESLVVAMLKAIDPAIEDIRSLASAATAGPREGFVVRYANESRRLPLGSLGDGVWRMLTLAVVLARCKGGMLLVDEIDTGLHHTVMADMWRLVYDAAKRLDIQVFATTHSEDCVYSLASICRDDENASDVTIQRIEAGRTRSIAYSEAEIRAAAEHRIEVR